MFLNKINNNTYMFLLIILLIIILFNMSHYLENNKSNTTIEKIKIKENFEDILYIQIIEPSESNDETILTIRLKNNNNLFNLNSLNLKKYDLIKLSNINKDDINDFYLKINKITKLSDRPDYSEIELKYNTVKFKNNKKTELNKIFNKLKGKKKYDYLNIEKLGIEENYILSENIKIEKNEEDLEKYPDRGYFIQLTDDDTNNNLTNISKFDVGNVIKVIINNYKDNNYNNNSFLINYIDKSNYKIYLDKGTNKQEYNNNFIENNILDNTDNKEVLILKYFPDDIIEKYFDNSADNIATLHNLKIQISNYKKFLDEIEYNL